MLVVFAMCLSGAQLDDSLPTPAKLPREIYPTPAKLPREIPGKNAPILEYARARGRVTCNGQPVVGLEMHMCDADAADPDDLLAVTVTDKDGEFDLQGSEDEHGHIDSYLWIVHSCHPLDQPRNASGNCAVCGLKFLVPEQTGARCQEHPCTEEGTPKHSYLLEKWMDSCNCDYTGKCEP